MINEKQRLIVEKALTPAAVIAGPGTGKTFTIVEKTIELIKNEHIDPDKILITTFTKKAANELITRIQSKLKEEDIRLNTSNMLIGNFHSLALNFLRKYKSYGSDIFQ
ncbi:MAG: UvrD-helicase domain-containing protein, partial [Anaerococcus sp.]|nr:UvrD-helicase domain-containing protein [Anaerococcus sp.]